MEHGSRLKGSMQQAFHQEGNVVLFHLKLLSVMMCLSRYAGLECHLVLRTSRQVVDQDPGLCGERSTVNKQRLVLHRFLRCKQQHVKGRLPR